MSEPLIHRGDIFFSAGEGLFTRLVTFHTSVPWWRRARVSHVGVCVEGGTLQQARFVSALSPTVDEHGYWPALEWAVYRPTNLTATERDRIAATARAMVGLEYDYTGLLLFALDFWAGLGLVDAFYFRRLIRPEDRAVCSAAATSWMAVQAATRKDFRIADARRATPEDLHSFCRETGFYREVLPLDHHG